MWKLPPPQTVTVKLRESLHRKIQVRNMKNTLKAQSVVVGLKRDSRQTASERIKSLRVQIKLAAEQMLQSSATLSQHICDESDFEAE